MREGEGSSRWNPVISATEIGKDIRVFRGRRMMLDADLARLYGVPTRVLNQAVRRNRERFPVDFMIQLDRDEFAGLRSQFVISKRRGGARYRPYAFSEHGAVMAANLLNSRRAVEVSIYVVRAFNRLRRDIANYRKLSSKLLELESRVGAHDSAIRELVSAIRSLAEPEEPTPRRKIGFRTPESSQP